MTLVLYVNIHQYLYDGVKMVFSVLSQMSLQTMAYR